VGGADSRSTGRGVARRGNKEALAKAFQVLGGFRAVLVDRCRMGLEEVEGLLRGVEELAKGLGAERQREGICRLRRRINEAMSDLLMAERDLREKAASRLSSLAVKRMEVVQQEEEVQIELKHELGLI
jgi:hypothetical protein